MSYVRLLAALAALFVTTSATAQWQVGVNQIPLGKGGGSIGFGVVGGSAGAGAKCLVDTVPPAFGTCGGSTPPGGTPGQVQFNSAGAFGGFTVGGDATLNTATGVLTLAVSGVTAGATGSATATPIITYDAKGRLTAVSSATVTPAIGSITGVAAGWATFGATPTSANLRGLLTDETGTGSAYFQGGDIGTPSAGVVTNLTGTASININGAVGATTPNTGAFTTVVASTSVQSPTYKASGAMTFQSNGSTNAGIINASQQWGIVNTSPKTTLDVNANTSSSPALTVATSIARLQAADAVSGGFEMATYGAGSSAGNIIAGLASGGTAASPAATANSAYMFNMRGYGYNSGAQLGGLWIIATSEAWSAGHQGTQQQWYTTPNASTTIAQAMQLNASGGLSIGTAVDGGTANILVGGHILASGTVPNVSSCGTSPGTPTGSDNFGKVVAGSGVLSSCVINFAKAWGSAPSCSVSSPTAIASMTVTTSTTQLTIGGTSLTSDTLSWTCGSSAWLLNEPANDNVNPGVYSRTG